MGFQQLSLAQHYHERTKYAPETLAQQAAPLDWSRQPSPFKTYPLGSVFSLKSFLEPAKGSAHPYWQRLSRLLYCTYGITGVVPYPDQPFYMRAAPSAGGLYPAEIYVLTRNDTAIPAGIYNYQVKDHALVQVWQSYCWSALQAACLWHPALERTHIALVVTAVFYRSAWRYGDRAYRRICLDIGHLLGNVELAANIHDFRAHFIGGFVDAQMNELLYLDPEQEGVLAVVALANLLAVDENLSPFPSVLPSATCYDYGAIASGELLRACHRASALTSSEIIYSMQTPSPRAKAPPEPPASKYNFPFGLRVSLSKTIIHWETNLAALQQTILQRRSTRQYSGQGIEVDQLAALLTFAYHPQDYRDQGLDECPSFFDPTLVETFIAVTRVRALEEGCYYYAIAEHELRQIRFKNFQEPLHFLCLNQDLGRDAAVVIFHTANLERAIARYGERAYRYLHMDAGHLGQRLNLAATALGLGVSGIGGFFDDQVNDLLGIPPEEAVLYITTVGKAA
ncbi:SagB/ThcOx family dehydrogenase [Thermosynechococcus sp. OHK43]|uniref:SagB/ThcOx family dehydrogenase n=1 Tax=Thermosynechococcus sp. OHK43 TaxID=2763133 RepID=UPI0025F4B257|nr:SagB/ThcOx family dehydrogenase [Thermosynechococcus sp. OHK43]